MIIFILVKRKNPKVQILAYQNRKIRDLRVVQHYPYYLILQVLFNEFLHPTDASHLQNLHHAICFMRHLHTFDFEHFIQLQEEGKSGGINTSLTTIGIICSSLFSM